MKQNIMQKYTNSIRSQNVLWVTQNKGKRSHSPNNHSGEYSPVAFHWEEGNAFSHH